MTNDPPVRDEQKTPDLNVFGQTRITDFLKKKKNNEKSVFSGVELSVNTRLQQVEITREQLRGKSEKSDIFNEKINSIVHSSILWGRSHDMKKQTQNEGGEFNTDGDQDKNIPPLQNFDVKPLFMGADVESLYPNLDKEITGELMYKAVMECDIQFNGIDYDRLSVYLLLMLGLGVMYKCGLGDCSPTRKDTKTTACSLNAKCNKEMDGPSDHTISQKRKKE